MYIKSVNMSLALALGLSLIFAFGFLSCFAQESITVTTYYPSPYGAYNDLQTNRFAVGDTNNSGALDAGDLPPTNGQLYTARSVIFRPQTGLPALNAREGELVYNNTDNRFWYYDGGAWVTQAGGGGCYVSYSGGCLAGFNNRGSVGWWGRCDNVSAYGGAFHYRPEGGSCPGGWIDVNIGQAIVCCQ